MLVLALGALETERNLLRGLRLEGQPGSCQSRRATSGSEPRTNQHITISRGSPNKNAAGGRLHIKNRSVSHGAERTRTFLWKTGLV